MTRVGASLFGTLFWWRLRHVAEAAYRLLLRRWQAVALVLLLSPRDMPWLQQLRVLATPVLVLTAPGPALTLVATWLAVLAVAQAWAQTQGSVLTGGPAWASVQMQPLPQRLARHVDLAVLAVCDLPLLLPFAAALAVLPGGPLLQRVLQAAAMVVAAAQLPGLQWAMARRPAASCAAVGVQLLGLLALAAGLTPLPFILGCLLTTVLLWQRVEAPGAPPAAQGAQGMRRARAPRRLLALPAGTPVWARLAGLRGVEFSRRPQPRAGQGAGLWRGRSAVHRVRANLTARWRRLALPHVPPGHCRRQRTGRRPRTVSAAQRQDPVAPLCLQRRWCQGWRTRRPTGAAAQVRQRPLCHRTKLAPQAHRAVAKQGLNSLKGQRHENHHHCR